MIRRWTSHEWLRPRAGWVRLAWMGYCAALIVLLHAPKLPHTPVGFRRQDLVAHFIAYGLLAIGLVLTRRARTPAISRRWKLSWFAILCAWAAVDELTQPLTGRDCDITDWIADVAAIGLVLWLARNDAAE